LQYCNRATNERDEREMKKYLVAGVAIATITLTGCTAGASQQASDGATPVPVPKDLTEPRYTPEPEYTYEPEYNCRNIVEQVREMAEEQHTSGSLLVGIKGKKLVTDNQPTSKKNGWVLKCEGVAVVSGSGGNQAIYYGIKNEGGDSYVLYEVK
jgi:hypothetical protein